MGNFLRDLRSAFRALRRGPGFATLALLLVALGVGANTLVLSWLRAVVLDPLPGVRDAHSLVHLSGVIGERNGLSLAPVDVDVLRTSRTLSPIVAHELQELALVGGSGEPQQLMGGIVSANYFDALGVVPQLGRGFRPDDDAAANANVAVLSDVLWRRSFGADPSIVGRSIELNHQPFTVVGVGPRDFGGTYGGLLQALWVPYAAGERLSPGQRVYLQIMGRRTPGSTLESVRAELPLLASRLQAADPVGNKSLSLTAWPLLESPRGILSAFVPLVTVLAVTAALLLALAWANLANLLLARGLARRRELAVRRALGAGRLDLLRWAGAEGLLLGVLGGALGLLVARAASPLLLSLLPIGMPLAFKVGLDPLACGGAVLLSLLAGLLFALVASGGERRMKVAETLKAEGAGALGGHGRARLRGILVGVQCGLATVALTAALLMARSARAAAHAEVGFTRPGALVATVQPRLGGYDAARSHAFLATLLERTAALPGVTAVSATTYVPMGGSGGGNGRRAEIEGYTPRPDEVVGIVTDAVGPAYVRAMGMRLAAGRELAPSDTEGAPPVVLVNAAFVKRYFGEATPAASAVGRRVKVSGAWREVVGVVEDFTYRGLGQESNPVLFVALLQEDAGSFSLVLRTAGETEAAALAPSLRAAVARLDATLPVTRVETLAEHARSMSDIAETLSRLLGACGALALVLAALGLYAVAAHAVGQRRREIGLRMALGADAGGVLRMVLRDGLVLGACGAGAGLLLGFGAAQLLRSLLYGVAAADPIAFGAAALLLAATSLLACLAPALSAARVEPLQALRYE
jgi:predicted permease